ncbi:MAG TPA: hydantoinase/oxoprolinase family protein [Candidatus Sulfotelmatobacter sp.]|jgi:N-methylhydantoinase A|nr:hydantoinase/oxoprolinase family protein [Candidatus Sulfotelmatobacter sp.]
MLFVGIDVGGTFTDIIVSDNESSKTPEIVKVPTIPRQPDLAILEALKLYQERAEQVALVSHATTIATNALLTQSGLAKTALITNHGFRDVLEIGRQRRPEIYNLGTKRPKQLVDRKNRFTARGRRLVNGSSQTPLAENELVKLTREIVRRGLESVAIAFLNSYTNPSDEIRAEEILRRSGFKGHIDLSSRVDPQYREYERTSTTVVNAALAPLMSKYLHGLERGVERIGFHCAFYVMNSDGTASTTAQASEHPISIIESGPAAGVLSSTNLAKRLSLDKIMTFDMGGTTAKVCTIIKGRPDLSYEFEAAGRSYHGRSIKGSGYPVRQPFIDLAEVSAGGGTIASLDDAGSLKVGPESAGADPGPAAYGKGGRQATVTDANIVAGRINPSQLLGGHLRLNYDLAVRAIRRLSSKLGTSVDKTAESILRIVNSNMSKALSLVSVERGRDPREYTMIAFGGSGPLHACDLAEELGIRRIVIPLHPGLFSALGLLTAELSRTFTQPILRTDSVERIFAQLREQARKSLKQEGFTIYQTTEQVDLRYQGQAYEITVPYKKEANLTKLFGREHKKLYGYSSLDAVEAVNARIQAIIPTPKAKFVKKRLQPSRPAAPILSRRMSLMGSWQKVPIYDRMSLLPGVSGKGPCITEEYDSTTVVGKNWTWRVGSYDEIHLTTVRVSRPL